MGNRIAESKHDPGVHGFCLKQLFATEAAFRSVLLLFNLLAELQRAAGLPGYREPATIRTHVLTCGAIPGRAGRHERAGSRVLLIAPTGLHQVSARQPAAAETYDRSSQRAPLIFAQFSRSRMAAFGFYMMRLPVAWIGMRSST
jgi:hypothetical protein